MASPEPPAGGNDDQAAASGQQLPAWSPQQELYDKHAGQAWTDQQASSDEFDKSLLTFSSGALALSLSFIKDIVLLEKAGFLCWLFVSWVSFSKEARLLAGGHAVIRVLYAALAAGRSGSCYHCDQRLPCTRQRSRQGFCHRKQSSA